MLRRGERFGDFLGKVFPSLADPCEFVPLAQGLAALFFVQPLDLADDECLICELGAQRLEPVALPSKSLGAHAASP